jgi:hypothetical protein
MLWRRILNFYLSFKLFANLFADVQAKPYATCELLLVSFKLSEYLEESRLILLRDPYPGVFHSSDKEFGAVIVIQMQPNSALIREFDRVLHQVDENLSDPLSIN